MAAAAVTCPFCQSAEWTTLPHGIVLREDDPRKRGGGFSALGFVCTGCGFIRLQMPEKHDDSGVS